MKTGNEANQAGDDVVTRPITETNLSFELLHRSATNPRRRFLPGPLKELAANILKWGVQTRLHVRPSKQEEGKFEIIAGERRHRSLELAMQEVESREDAGEQIQRLMQVPVKVTDWTDDEVIDFQLIENVQREDLTPLEEADSFAQMVKRGKSVEEIAAAINREANYIYRALKWARLPDLAREAFERGILKKELATMIARIPDEKMRLRATLELVFFPHDLVEEDKDIEESTESAWAYLKDEVEAIQPMSVKEAREQAARLYMKSLKGAPFELDDEGLLAVEMDEAGERVRGGDCASCPFRTGNNVLYVGETAGVKAGRGGACGMDENTCTKPACYGLKLERLWERTKEEAAAKGLTVMDTKTASELFYNGGSMRYGSEYVDINAKPSLDLVDDKADDDDYEAAEQKLPTWKKLLKNVEIEKIVALDRDHVPHVLVKRDVAITAVNEKAEKAGQPSLFANAAKANDRPSGDAYAAQQKKQQEEKKRDQRAFVLALDHVRGAVLEEGVDGDGWEKLTEAVVLDLDMDGVRMLAAALAVKPEPPSKKEGNLNAGHYAAAIMEGMRMAGPTPTGWQALLIAALSARSAWRLLDSATLKVTAGHWGVSLTEMKNLAKDEMKEKKAKKQNKAAAESKTAAADTEQINAEITTQSIIAEGDKQREEMPSRKVGPAAENPDTTEYYHCDCCGKVCALESGSMQHIRLQNEMADLPEGGFVCAACPNPTKLDGYCQLPPLRADLQTEFETWVPPQPHRALAISGKAEQISRKNDSKVSKNQRAGESEEEFRTREAARIAALRAAKKKPAKPTKTAA